MKRRLSVIAVVLLFFNLGRIFAQSTESLGTYVKKHQGELQSYIESETGTSLELAKEIHLSSVSRSERNRRVSLALDRKIENDISDYLLPADSLVLALTMIKLFVGLQTKEISDAEGLKKLKTLPDKTISTLGDSSWLNSDVYAKIYGVRILSHLLSSPQISAEEKTNLAELKNKIVSALNKDVTAQFGKEYNGVKGIITYSYAASLYSLKDEKEAKSLREKMIAMIDSALRTGNELALPYDVITDIPTYSKLKVRDGAARTPVVYLSVWSTEENEVRKSEYRELLKKSLTQYLRFSLDLIIHTARGQTHQGKSQLAPYYYYPTLPYIAEAYRSLLDTSSNAEERSELMYEVKLLDDLIQSLWIEKEKSFLQAVGPSGRLWSNFFAAQSISILGELRERDSTTTKDELESLFNRLPSGAKKNCELGSARSAQQRK
jgi:hypothetical protein